VNADDLTDYLVDDDTWFTTGMAAYDRYQDYTIGGDQAWYGGNRAYAVQMWLDAMGALSEAYECLGVDHV
jgi:hypothetical protein